METRFNLSGKPLLYHIMLLISLGDAEDQFRFNPHRYHTTKLPSASTSTPTTGSDITSSICCAQEVALL